MAESFYIPPPSTHPAAPPTQGHMPPPPQRLHPHSQPQQHHPGPEPLKPGNNLRIKKIVLSLSALVFPLVTISLSYAAVFPSSTIYFTFAPLAASAIFLLISIVSALYLGASPERYAKLAVLPILFAAVSSGMIILFNVNSKALSDGEFLKVNIFAVLISASVFGGVALGSSVAFLMFAG